MRLRESRSVESLSKKDLKIRFMLLLTPLAA